MKKLKNNIARGGNLINGAGEEYKLTTKNLNNNKILKGKFK